MSKYRINRKPTYSDSPDQQECDWLDTGLDVEAVGEDDAIETALRLKAGQATGAIIPSDRSQLMASLYVL